MLFLCTVLLPSHLHTYLLSVFLGVGEHGGDVEHDLVLLERRVDRVGAGLVLVHVQAAPVYQGRLTRQIIELNF